MNPVLRWAILIVLSSATAVFAQNTVTFDNQSGEPTLVRLIGPTSLEVVVDNSKRATVDAAAGRYVINVRYGAAGQFRYSQGEAFNVEETPTATSATTITLHMVVDGNYESIPITEAEFGAGRSVASAEAPAPASWQVTGPVLNKELIIALKRFGDSPRVIHQTLEFANEKGDTPQKSILAMIDSMKTASTPAEIADGIATHANHADIVTTTDWKSILTSGLPPERTQQMLAALLDDPERTRRAVAAFFPMRKGMAWDYEVKIRGSYWICDGCIQSVRAPDVSAQMPNMRIAVVDVTAGGSTCDALLAVDNNVMRFDPTIGAPKQKLYPTELCDACRPVTDGLAVTNVYRWREVEVLRLRPDGKPTTSKDVRVSEQSERAWKTPGTGERKTAVCWHEVFFAPLMDSMIRKDGPSGVRTRFRLGESTVVTPTGTYTGCIERVQEISLDGEKWTTVSTFAKNVGMVRTFQRNPKGDIVMDVILLKMTAGAQDHTEQ